MWWKIIAVLYALGYAYAIFDAAHDETAFRLITTVLLLPGLVGLLLFAFKKRLLPRPLWKAYVIMFVAYWAFPLALGAKTLIDAHGILIYVIIVAACGVFLLPVVRSLWWLSFARTADETSASR